MIVRGFKPMAPEEEYAKTLNMPGYHLHFGSDDRQSGGHLLQCRGPRAGRGRPKASTPVTESAPHTGARLLMKSPDADTIAAAAIRLLLAQTKPPVVCTYQGAGSRGGDPWLSEYLEKGEH